MSDGTPEQPSDQDAQNKSKGREQHQILKRPNKPRVAKVKLYTWGATLFGLLSSALFSFNHWKFANLILLAAFVMAGFGIRLERINHHSTKRSANLWCALVCFSGLTVCCWMGFLKMKDAPLRPHFRISVTTPDFITQAVELTNELFQVGEDTNVYPTKGIVLLPLSQSQKSAVLFLIIKNDGDITAESLQIMVGVPKELRGVAAETWMPMMGPDIGMQLWEFNLPFALHTNDIVAIPEIVFPSETVRGPFKYWTLKVTVKTKEGTMLSLLANCSFFTEVNGLRLKRPVVETGFLTNNGSHWVGIPLSDLITNSQNTN